MGNEFLHNQLIKLGDMMGDGLHYEPDGKWIAKEYRKIARLLFEDDPEMQKIARKRREQKNDLVDKQMSTLLSEKKCLCGGELKQARSGSKVCYCTVCKKRYKAKPTKQG